MVTCYTDGGCDNTVKSNAYGSFAIYDNSGCIYKVRLDQPSQTSNEAEYDTLLSLLNYLVENNIRDVQIFSDSKLVVNQVNGGWKVMAENLKQRRKRAVELINQLNSVRLSWVSRKVIVSILGH